MSCSSQSKEECQETAQTEENQFYIMFSTAFQSEPACSGLWLFALNSPDGDSLTALQKVNRVPVEDQWMLNVSFRPEHDKQGWSLQRMVKLPSASGEGDPHSIALKVCSIVRGTGGSVVE
jgi:hypothetical protein